MKESIWFQEFEKEVQEKRKKGNYGKRNGSFILPLMAVLIVLDVLALVRHGGISSPQGKYYLCVTVVAVLGFAIILLGRSKRVDAIKGTGENVRALFKSDDEVDRFDEQMQSSPLMSEQMFTEYNITVFLTTDYVGMKFLLLDEVQYRFAHRNDIAVLEISKASRGIAGSQGTSYFFNVKNAKNKLLMGGYTEKYERIEKLEVLLRTAQPNLAITKKGMA